MFKEPAMDSFEVPRAFACHEGVNHGMPWSEFLVWRTKFDKFTACTKVSIDTV
jgi:hypothetical protein